MGKICECGGIMNYDPYFKADVCNTCGKRDKTCKDESAIFCKCGCANGVVMKFDNEDEELSLQLVSDNFYLTQSKGGMSLMEKLKRIWQHPESVIKKIISVKYKEETRNKDGGISIQFPVFEAIRFDKNNPSYN